MHRIRRINDITIPRCLKPAGCTSDRRLHVFTDASESGYGAAAYVRYELQDGTGRARLLYAKARVAPLKSVTIPRLELVAALLAAKIARQIEKEASMDFVQRFLWTDSAVVLRYLANTSARFQTFVANRVRQIRELSSIGMWRHIPGEVNPADLASRGLESFSEVQLHMWFEGPAILSEPVKNWPRLPEIDSDLDAQLEFKGAAA